MKKNKSDNKPEKKQDIKTAVDENENGDFNEEGNYFTLVSGEGQRLKLENKIELLDDQYQFQEQDYQYENLNEIRDTTETADIQSSAQNFTVGNSFVGKKSGLKAGSVKKLKVGVGFGSSIQRWLRKLAVTGVVVTIFVVLILSAATAWAINRYNEAPNISEGNLFNLKESSIVYARDGTTKIFEFFDTGKREYIPLEKVPEVMQLAILSLEDQNFYYNSDGIPWANIAGKVVDCGFSLGNDCAGASGILQQLVKNAQDDRENSFNRKTRELFTAIKLYQEGAKQDGKRVNKSDILELYLNQIPFSRYSFGVMMASRSYFGHDVDAKENPADPNSPYLLTPPKACYLAALVQQQSKFNNSINDKESPKFKEFEARKNSCLQKLAGDGRGFSIRGDGRPLFIQTDEELAKWTNLPIEFVSTKYEDPFPHFRGYVQNEIVKFLVANNLSKQDLYRRGLKIKTTIDPELQKKAEKTLLDARGAITKSGGDNGAAIILDGPTGEILSMVGSLDYNDESIQGKNNILLTPQQPGSSIKPYVYATALDRGFNPGTIIGDTDTTFTDPQINASPFRPRNYSRTFSGGRSIHYSLQNSLNIPAVKAGLLDSSEGNSNIVKGLDNFYNFSESAGVRFSCIDGAGTSTDKCESLPETGQEAQHRERCFAPVFIGGCELTALSHATGMNTLFQEGNLRTASPFISIVDRFGQELYNPNFRDKVYPQVDKKIKPEVAKQISWIMTDQNRREFGQYQPFFNIPDWKLAAKTGTTDGNRDTWMVGGSPLYTTVVWAGRTDNGEMNTDTTASNLAAPIWQSLQRVLHDGKKPVNFSTTGLKEVYLSASSGLQGGGNLELLSDEQIAKLKQYGSVVARPTYDPRKR